jgi:hypothetical protein
MAFKMKGTGLYARTASKNGGSFKHTAKFGSNTTMGEMAMVEDHNKRHQKGDTHSPNPKPSYKTGISKDSVRNVGEWSAKKEGGEGAPKKYKKAKPVAKKHKPAHKKVGDKFTEGTIPSHVKKAFPNLTLAEFNKDKQGYNKKAIAKAKAGDKPMTKYKKK